MKTMVLKILEVLQKGLKVLKTQVKSRKEALQARLADRKSISSQDKRWLDYDANFVDEQQILEALENASDYECAFANLDDEQQGVVRKLQEAAGDLSKVIGKKRKRAYQDLFSSMAGTDQPKGTEPSHKKPVKENVHSPMPVFTKKENATLEQRIEVLNWYHANGKNQSKMAKHFDKTYPNLKIKQPLVSAWVKEEERWREAWACSGARTAKRAQQTQHPEVTKMMDLWVSKAMSNNIILTGKVLRQQWTKFADLMGIPEDDRLSLSDGWLARFKARNGLKEFKRHGEAASASSETVEREKQRIQELLKEYGVELRDVFNMDETGLFYGYTPLLLRSSSHTDLLDRMPPDRGLADKKSSGVKGKKVRLTYLFTANADGSEKLPPLIIGKAKKPRAFENKTGAQLGFQYRNNAKAWMTANIYQEWLRQWDHDLGVKRRSIVLLQDNFSGHIVPAGLQNIRVVNFEPNLTAHIQPMDQGIIRCFKAHYRAKYIQRAIHRYDANITPSEIYDINQLQAMRLADLAWHEVDTTTI